MFYKRLKVFLFGLLWPGCCAGVWPQLFPDADAEELLKALLTLLTGCPFTGCLYTTGGVKDAGLQKMNAYLSLRTFLTGHRVSLLDLGVYVHLRTGAGAEKTGALPDNW